MTGISTQEDHAFDRALGARVRERRIALGLSQQELADKLGVTYQQAQKYERGSNGMRASRLATVSRMLDMPVNDLLGLDHGRLRAEPDSSERERLELVKAYKAIATPQLRAAARTVVRAIAGVRGASKKGAG